MHDSLSALQRAAEIVGSKRQLAAALDVKPSTMQSWKAVPAEYCAAIEHLTGGKVTRQDLRPDIGWIMAPAPEPELREAKAPAEALGEIADILAKDRHLLPKPRKRA